MCLTCGCLQPEEDHGDRRNILLGALTAAAAAGHVTPSTAAWNIPRTLRTATEPAWPPPPSGVVHRAELVWDVDGVLAFTAEALTGALNARYGSDYDPASQRFFTGTLIPGALPPEQAAWLTTIAAAGRLDMSMAPDWHAMDALGAACQAGWACHVVTERSPAAQDVTRQWLTQWGCPLPPAAVLAVGHGNKPQWMAARFGPGRPAILIDDNPAVRVTIARPGITVWSPVRPYTPAGDRAHVHTFHDWRTVRDRLGLAPRPGDIP